MRQTLLLQDQSFSNRMHLSIAQVHMRDNSCCTLIDLSFCATPPPPHHHHHASQRQMSLSISCVLVRPPHAKKPILLPRIITRNRNSCHCATTVVLIAIKTYLYQHQHVWLHLASQYLVVTESLSFSVTSLVPNPCRCDQ